MFDFLFVPPQLHEELVYELEEMEEVMNDAMVLHRRPKGKSGVEQMKCLALTGESCIFCGSNYGDAYFLWKVRLRIDACKEELFPPDPVPKVGAQSARFTGDFRPVFSTPYDDDIRTPLPDAI